MIIAARKPNLGQWLYFIHLTDILWMEFEVTSALTYVVSLRDTYSNVEFKADCVGGPAVVLLSFDFDFNKVPFGNNFPNFAKNYLESVVFCCPKQLKAVTDIDSIPASRATKTTQENSVK